MLAIFFILSIIAGDTLELTLDHAIEYALIHNPEIVQLQIELERSDLQVGQALSAFYPSVTASGGYAYITDVPVIEFDSIPIPFGQSENYSFQLSLQQVLFSWGTIYNAYRISDISRKVARLNLERKEQEVRYAVTDAFYGLLVLEEIAALSRESYEQLKRHEQAVEKRYKAGLVPQFELLRAQVQVANLKPQVIKAENGLNLSYEAFKMLLGMDMDSEFAVIGELAMIDEKFLLEELTDSALNNRAELKGLKEYRNIAQLGKRIAATANLPVIVAGATYERQKPFGFTGDEWGSDIIFNIGFQWTIFSGFRNLYKYREATLEEKAAENAYENLVKGVVLEVKQAYLNFMASKEALISARENVGQAEMAFEIIETRYRNGLATNLEFMDAQLASMQAHANYFSALKDHYTSRAEIYKAIGKEE
jgi:outer membrane protein